MIVPTFPELVFFISATLLLNLTPGVDVLYIATRSLSQGKVYGAVAAAGISSGLIIHVFLTAFGMGEIFRYSPLAFWALKILGVGYLGYLGWKAFFGRESLFKVVSESRGTLLNTYGGGILTTLLNPKVILFFITFLPQFADTSKGHMVHQLLFLGGVFILCGTVVNLSYALFFSLFKDWLLKSQKVSWYLQKLTGLLFGALACKLLLADSR